MRNPPIGVAWDIVKTLVSVGIIALTVGAGRSEKETPKTELEGKAQTERPDSHSGF